MRSASALLFALPLFFVVAACEEKKPPTVTAPSATAALVPSSVAPLASAAAAASAVVTNATRGKMGHCPSAVDGAKTVIKDVPDGVELTITTAAPTSVADIRTRTKALVDSSKAAAGKEHNGTGEGGGVTGRCPIIMRDTALAVTDVEGGVKVTVTAEKKAELDWVRAESRGRLADLDEAESAADAGGGGGKMAHCPNAVEGATTKLTENKDGVDILVTATGEAVVKQIRERAKRLAATSADGGKPEHNGTGHGGGGVGRCPVVVQDTTLDVKDVEGGSKISVKAKSAAKAADLKKEIKERSVRFQLPASAPAASASAAPKAAAPKAK